MRLKLLDSWVAIAPLHAEDFTPRGLVLDVGAGVDDVEVGQVVVYCPDAGVQGEVNYRKCRFVERDFLIGIVEGPPDPPAERKRRRRARIVDPDSPRDPLDPGLRPGPGGDPPCVGKP